MIKSKWDRCHTSIHKKTYNVISHRDKDDFSFGYFLSIFCTKFMFFSIYHWVHYIFSFNILRSRILFCCIVTFELFIIIVWTFRLFPRLGYWFVLHPKKLPEFKSLHLRTCVYLCACPIHTCVLWTYIFMFPQYVLYWLGHLPTTIKNFFRCLIFIAKLFI